MDDLLSNLIPDSSGFIRSRTIIPGSFAVTPSSMMTPRRGPVLLSNPGRASSRQPFQHQHSFSRSNSQFQSNSNPSQTQTSASVLRTDMSQMIAWLTSQNNTGLSSNTQSQATSSMAMINESQHFNEAPTIPKSYNDLTRKDCAGVIAKAIRSVIMHTCNDEFRLACFTKLGVSSSGEAQREVKRRLTEMIELEEQEEMEQQSEESEGSPAVTTTTPTPP